MKYIVALFILILAIIAIFIFNPPKPADDIEKTLKISTYVFNKDVTDPNVWYENDDMKFELTQLEPGNVYLLAPPDAVGMYNYNILFEYEDGIIDVTSDYVQLTKGDGFEPWHDLGLVNGLTKQYPDRIYGYEMQVSDSGYLTFYPIGSGIYGFVEFDQNVPAMGPRPVTEIGHEYYVTVKAYRDISDKFPVAEVQLKFIKLADSDDRTLSDGYSNFCSIELIS